MTLESWLLYCSIALAATLSPGPAVLLVTTHSLRYGPVRSIYTILGNISGLFIMSFCSVIGLSALLLYSSLAFGIIKTVGAAYLIWLGIKLWRNGLGTEDHAMGKKMNGKPATLYRQGLFIALTNPKAIAFTTALFPQFIITTDPLTRQFLPLICILMTFSFICLSGYALASYKVNKHTGPLLEGKCQVKFSAVYLF